MKTLTAALAAAAFAGAAPAATLDRIVPLAAPAVAGPFDVIYTPLPDRPDALDASTFDFSTFFSVGFDEGAGFSSFGDDLVIEAAAVGSLVDAALAEDMIALLFDTTDLDDGDGADWSAFALATLAVPGVTASSLAGGDFGSAEVELTAAQVIPLPAAAPMLLAGLVALVGLRRRRS